MQLTSLKRRFDEASGMESRMFTMHRPVETEEVMQSMRHDPVMLKEVLQLLDLKPGFVYFDATLGLGGHAIEAGRRIAPGGKLVGFDWDQSMLDEARNRLDVLEDIEKVLVHADFRFMRSVSRQYGLNPNGILMDLGLNSAQVEDPERGIAFKTEGPLDMRMDRSVGEPASALLNRLSPDEIERILREYGDERWARMIAKRIVERRREKPLRTTTDLVEAVLAAIPSGAREKRIHPATRTFQAVRIAVNNELEGLDEALQDAAEILAPNGVLAVLSYHSGEDRIVKRKFRDLDGLGFEDIYKKPQEPGPDEKLRNPRSRSAKLRAIRRIAW